MRSGIEKKIVLLRKYFVKLIYSTVIKLFSQNFLFENIKPKFRSINIEDNLLISHKILTLVSFFEKISVYVYTIYSESVLLWRILTQIATASLVIDNLLMRMIFQI